MFPRRTHPNNLHFDMPELRNFKHRPAIYSDNNYKTRKIPNKPSSEQLCVTASLLQWTIRVILKMTSNIISFIFTVQGSQQAVRWNWIEICVSRFISKHNFFRYRIFCIGRRKLNSFFPSTCRSAILLFRVTGAGTGRELWARQQGE